MNVASELRYRMFLDRFTKLRDARDALVCLRWALGVKRAPFPPAVKRAILQDLAEKHHVDLLVETGTFVGDTSAQLAASFRQVHTIEAVRELFDAVAPRLEKFPNVHRYLGDSGVVLPSLLPRLDAPTLFWLDAHLQGFAHDGEANPILREVSTIAADVRFNHVLAIDDMREFGRVAAYPSIDLLLATIAKAGRRFHFGVTADIGVIRFET
jgi:hypothetical protein